MKYSKDGTLYDLRRCGEYWIVVSFYNPYFGKEVGKGSEAAMRVFYELLTKDGSGAVGFECNGAQVVMPKIEMFVEDKIETTGLLKRIEGCANQPCESMIQQEILDRLSSYSAQKQKQCWNNHCIPSQTKPSCELGKAQKDFLSRLKLSGEKA